MLLVAVTSLGISGAIQVALPKLVYNIYGHGHGVWLLGMITAVGGIGALLALLLLPTLHHLPRRGIIIYGSFMLSGFALVAFSLPLPDTVEAVIACIAMVVLTFGLTVPELLFVTVMQEQVSTERLGRVSSIYQLASYATWPLGFAVSGLVADHMSPARVFLGAGVITVVLYGLALGNRAVRQA